MIGTDKSELIVLIKCLECTGLQAKIFGLLHIFVSYNAMGEPWRRFHSFVFGQGSPQLKDTRRILLMSKRSLAIWTPHLSHPWDIQQPMKFGSPGYLPANPWNGSHCCSLRNYTGSSKWKQFFPPKFVYLFVYHKMIILDTVFCLFSRDDYVY